MSLGILTLKIGLVATVTGVSIATPILLNRGVLSTSIASAQTESIQPNSFEDGSRVEGRAGLEGHNSESIQREQEVRAGDSHNRTTSTPSQLTSVNFDKTCFEVPITSESDSNLQLLTCFETAKEKNAHLEQTPEFDSLFHLYNKNTKNNPVDVSEKLEWSAEKNKITVNLTEISGQTTKHSFTVDDNLKNSFAKSTSLKDECAIFGVNSRDSEGIEEYWLACGEDTDTFADEQKGIKLNNWKRQ